MNMEHSQYVKLQDQLQDHFDGRYVRLEDCEKNVEKSQDKIDALSSAFATFQLEQVKSNTKLTILIAILGAIAAILLPMCINSLFS